MTQRALGRGVCVFRMLPRMVEPGPAPRVNWDPRKGPWRTFRPLGRGEVGRGEVGSAGGLASYICPGGTVSKESTTHTTVKYAQSHGVPGSRCWGTPVRVEPRLREQPPLRRPPGR